MTSVTLDVLGPWEVRVGGHAVRIPRGQLQVLLAALLVAVDEPVAMDTLVVRLWPEDPREGMRNTLYIYVKRLRTLLGPDVIETTASGYRLRVAADGVDLYRFRDLARRANEAVSVDDELALLRAALRLWRGRPFGDLPSTWLDRDVVPGLTEEWLTLTERRLDLELPVRPTALIAELRDLTNRYPTRESLWCRLITALHRTGRRAEALDAYEQVRRLLGDELGIEPSQRLVDLQRTVLLDGVTQPNGASRNEPSRDEPSSNGRRQAEPPSGGAERAQVRSWE